MKNSIEDLRNHLFAQLERLGEEGLKGEALDLEVKRSRAISDLAGRLVESAKAETEFLQAIGESRGTGFIPQDSKQDQKALESPKKALRW